MTIDKNKKNIFLLNSSLPLENGDRYIIRTNNSSVKKIKRYSEIPSDVDYLVSHDVHLMPALTEFCKLKNIRLIDSTILFRSITGAKFKGASKNGMMNFFSYLYAFLKFSERYDSAKKIAKLIIDRETAFKNLEGIMLEILTVINEVLNNPDYKKNRNRLIAIETPLLTYFNKVAATGINLSKDNINTLVNNIDSRIFAIENGEQFDIHIDYENKELSRLRKSRKALLLSMSGTGVVHPAYDIWGTVTSRIMVRDPYLQYIPSATRYIFKESLKEGERLIYPDYDSFEPAILAGEVGGGFLESYNKGDIYNKVSDIIFDSYDYRKKAKGIFISLAYGRSDSNIIKDISQTLNVSLDDAENRLITLKSKFHDLFQWIDDLKRLVLADGVCGKGIQTPRYIKDANRSWWITSHYIQSKSSLIFKEVLCELIQLEGVTPLVPMHDGVICKIDSSISELVISQLFIDIFKNFYPNVNIKVSFESLDPTE